MLVQISHLRQSNRSLVKRWFTSLDMDLFIWYRKNTPVKFQLSYNKRNDEHAISWDFHHGFRHYLVDTGECDPAEYKRTPLLIDVCAQENLASLPRDFLVASENIEIGVSDFIYSRLMAYPIKPLPQNAMQKDHFAGRESL